MGNYADRTGVLLANGARSYTTKTDIENQRKVAEVIEAVWQCKAHHLGVFAPVDWWLESNGHTYAWAELKSASGADSDWPHALLNVRKWLALQLAHLGTGIPAFFVSKVEDKIRYIDVRHIDARRLKIIPCGGGFVKSENDTEPCIMVPKTEMKDIKPTIATVADPIEELDPDVDRKVNGDEPF